MSSESCAGRWQEGWTLIEVGLALCFVSGLAMTAGASAVTLLRLAAEAHAEAVGLAVAASRLEELLAADPERRAPGTDVVALGGTEVTRIWRPVSDDPAAGLWRIEVTARWERPSIAALTLVGVGP